MEFLKAPIADLITLFLLSLQNAEGCGNGDSGDSCTDPCQFLPFTKTKFNFQPLSFTFETFGKNLQKQRSLLGSIGKKSKQINRKKGF